MLIDAEKRQREAGVSLWLAGIPPDVYAVVQRSALGETLGRERLAHNLEIAVDRYLTSSKKPEVAAMKAKKKSRGNGKEESSRLTRKEYEKKLEKLHVELVKAQQWIVHKGLKVCIVFEGRDGAGKGGTIKAITDRVSPRVFRVVALPAPSEREKSQMYVQRYLPLFAGGRRSRHFRSQLVQPRRGRAVMGFCSKDEVQHFLRMVPPVEKAIVDSGVILLKYWLEVSPEEQTRRLEARIEDGRKIWKLSPMDLKSYSRWYDYSRARDDMFARPIPPLHRGMWRKARTSGACASISSRTYLSRSRTRHCPGKNKAAEAPEARRLSESKHPLRMVKEVF